MLGVAFAGCFCCCWVMRVAVMFVWAAARKVGVVVSVSVSSTEIYASSLRDNCLFGLPAAVLNVSSPAALRYSAGIGEAFVHAVLDARGLQVGAGRAWGGAKSCCNAVELE